MTPTPTPLSPLHQHKERRSDGVGIDLGLCSITHSTRHLAPPKRLFSSIKLRRLPLNYVTCAGYGFTNDSVCVVFFFTLPVCERIGPASCPGQFGWPINKQSSGSSVLASAGQVAVLSCYRECIVHEWGLACHSL